MAGRCFLIHLFFEAVLQADAAVEYQTIGTAVLIVEAEVAETHELEGRRILTRTVLRGIKLFGFFHQ